MAPHERKHLEKCLWPYVRQLWGWRRPRCAQFVRHLSVWVALEALADWDVEYTLVEQRAGECMVTAPGAYHQGWNAGANVAEAINYGDAASAERAQGYRACTAHCQPRHGSSGSKRRKAVKLDWLPADVREASRVPVPPRPAAAPVTASALEVRRSHPKVQAAPWCTHDVLLGDREALLQIAQSITNGHRRMSEKKVCLMFSASSIPAVSWPYL